MTSRQPATDYLSELYYIESQALRTRTALPMTSRPSDLPYDPDEYDPGFGWDSTVLPETCRELRRLLTFPRVFRTSTIINVRELPLFAATAGTYNFVVTSVIQTFGERRTFWLQVCVADVRLGGEVKGKVVLKILQPSLLPIPQHKAEDHLGYYVSPRHLARMNDLVYGKLESLQDTVIPYYFGLQKVHLQSDYSSFYVIFCERLTKPNG
ncbi:hypothetical protein EV421DRAFT_1945751 [Armillaria borealis]|uniref:Uncharacterized protein n=1 Tax=Armillaria borealis TaxID=47425 RepID=A0AA39IU07_9AGAR|nr:hypothetical protein EV421DRAFT_1945751 [Armillaria borealis]